MYTVLLILIILAAILMVGIVLIQESKGGGLASNFASYNQIGGVRKTTDFIEKTTWGLAAAMVIISILCAYTAPTRSQQGPAVMQMQNNLIVIMADIVENRDENTGGHIRRTAKYVEVIARGINKGYFISYIIKDNLNKDIIPDFIFCIGDDTTDEKMFYYLKNKINVIKEYSKNINIITCTVGKKPSNAHYYVNNTKAVQEIIESFVENTKNLHSVGSHENIKLKTIEEINE